MIAYRKRLYQILVEGNISRIDDERLSGWQLKSLQDGNTLMTGPGIDSSALYGILAALRDNGIILLGIREVQTSPIEGDKK
ncbi:hypothetical protein [Marispirochaeta sp.]|jgi:hypothetical protein|uniref:hypothetical protein n=1 Tax=Marispirochaeta sp. TaxID=2038653 RepID=UPI0029C813E4|nr:hypothetical protein [Marispirochaeta sp.]